MLVLFQLPLGDFTSVGENKVFFVLNLNYKAISTLWEIKAKWCRNWKEDAIIFNIWKQGWHHTQDEFHLGLGEQISIDLMI